MRNRLKAFIDANIETINGKAEFNFIPNYLNAEGTYRVPFTQIFYVNDTNNTQLKLKEIFNFDNPDIDDFKFIVCTLISYDNNKAIYEIKTKKE